MIMAGNKGKYTSKSAAGKNGHKRNIMPMLLGMVIFLVILIAAMCIWLKWGNVGQKNPDQSGTHVPTEVHQENGSQQTEFQDPTESADAADPLDEPEYSMSDVVNAYIDDRGHLILELEDGTKIDKGDAQENAEANSAATYLVCFVDYDGRVLKNETVKAGSDAVPPEAPTREGYTFVGWNGSYVFIQNNVTLVAQYRPNETPVELCTVTFVDGMGNVLKTQVVEKGAAAEAPAEPVRKGYRFIGWDKAFDKVTSDLTVTAQFESVADTAPTVYVADTKAKAGETVQVYVMVKNNPGIAGSRLLVAYDERLTLTGAESGEAFAVLDYTAPAALTSGCAFNWDSLDAESKEDGVILVLNFTVPAGAASGDVFRVEVYARDGDTYNVDLNSVPITMKTGTITVD